MSVYYSREYYKEKYEYFKSKASYYTHENKELKEVIKNHSSQLEKKDEKILEAQDETKKIKAKLSELSLKHRTISHQKKQIGKNKHEKIIEINQFKRDVLGKISYLVKAPNWDTDTDRRKTVEVILRAIVTYNRLITGKIITFNEIAFLLVANQKDAFNLKDVYARFGKMNYYHKREFAEFVEAGLFKKMYKKNKWYITVEGNERLEDILRYIYENKVGVYNEIKKLNEVI